MAQMQDHTDTQPLQTLLQDNAASSSIGHAPVYPSNATSDRQPSGCEESTLGLPSAVVQFVLLAIILYAARKQYPQLELTVLVACGAMFVLLLVWKNWVSGLFSAGLLLHMQTSSVIDMQPCLRM